ncbi:MAG: hypothetical protein L6R37_006914 [Teloschistes peruensis]|nr:MAG: hypothetical protein L6R37_006914 [Teloschistes peruensis]
MDLEVGPVVIGKDELCDRCKPITGADVVTGLADALTDVLLLEDVMGEDEKVEDDAIEEFETEDEIRTFEVGREEGSANDPADDEVVLEG